MKPPTVEAQTAPPMTMMVVLRLLTSARMLHISECISARRLCKASVRSLQTLGDLFVGAFEPADAPRDVRGGLGGHGIDSSPSTFAGAIASAPMPIRFVLAGLSNVISGLPVSAKARANASVRPPEAAWAMKTLLASSATYSCSPRVPPSAFAERKGRARASASTPRPAGRASHAGGASPRCRAQGRRPPASRRAAAGAGTPSPIGVWNSPTTGTPASRIARTRSYVFRIRSPGQQLEQNRAVSCSSSRRRLPTWRSVSGGRGAVTALRRTGR